MIHCFHGGAASALNTCAAILEVSDGTGLNVKKKGGGGRAVV